MSIERLVEKLGLPEQLEKRKNLVGRKPDLIKPVYKEKVILPVDEQLFLRAWWRNFFEVLKGNKFVPFVRPETVKKLVLLFNTDKPIDQFVVLYGPFGTGKTKIMTSIGRTLWMQKNHFSIVQSKRLIEIVKEEDLYGLKRYNDIGLCIDDFGYNDDEIKRYGNSIQAIDDLVFNRIEVYGRPTFFTTNIKDQDEFLSKFNPRTADRIKSKLLWIFLGDKNYRHNGS